MTRLRDALVAFSACGPSLTWFDAQPIPKDVRAYWDTCPCGDWLVWLIETARPDGYHRAFDVEYAAWGAVFDASIPATRLRARRANNDAADLAGANAIRSVYRWEDVDRALYNAAIKAGVR